MKLAPILLAGSIAANVALVAVYFTRASSPTRHPTGSSTADSRDGHATASHSAAAVPSTKSSASLANSGASSSASLDSQTWAQLNPGDFRALATQLRAAGFPPSIIHAVLTAQINASLRPRLQQLLATIEEKPFWSTETNFFAMDPKAMAASRELSTEHNRLLKEAMGNDYLVAQPEAGESLRRRYGDLPLDKIEALQRIEQDYSELRNQVTTAARGLMLPEDREKLALLEKEKNTDLAGILNPHELDEFLLRSSPTTSRLRNTLTLLNASDDEFRAIFKAQSAFDEKFNNTSGAVNYIGADSMKDREAALAQVNDQIKAAIGDQRFAQYLRASDREYQSLARITQQAGLPASVAVQAFDLRENLSKESNRIFSDTALSTDQKRAALQSLAQNTRTQITATLGPDAGRNYLQTADRWLSSVERGAAVTFMPGGGTRTRSLPMAVPAGASGHGSTTTSTTTNVIINETRSTSTP